MNDLPYFVVWTNTIDPRDTGIKSAYRNVETAQAVVEGLNQHNPVSGRLYYLVIKKPLEKSSWNTCASSSPSGS